MKKCVFAGVLALGWATGALRAEATEAVVQEASAPRSVKVDATTGGPWLTFSLARSGPPSTHFQIRLEQGTGQGFYRSDDPPVAGTSATTADGAEIPIAVEPPLLAKLFATVPTVQAHRCESHRSGIAQTGQKTLQFHGNGVAAECTFNYSQDDRLNAAAMTFEAIAQTMEYGDRLRYKLRFDRLGLDAEIDGLTSAVTEGMAIEVGNIAPVLQAIANDDRVMDRVRRKATHLLETAGVAVVQPTDVLDYSFV